MIKVKKNVLEQELTYDGVVILTYHIEYPSILGDRFVTGIQKFNRYNQKIAFALREKSKQELYQEAVETYHYNKENGFPIMVYEVYQTFEVTLAEKEIVSLYIDQYFYTGGAHGNTIRTSQTWNLLYGKLKKLEEFFQDPYFVLTILRSIQKQIQENKENYFEDACCLMVDTFNPKQYYLINSRELIIYFQQYDIAPYSSGIPTFRIERK